MTLASIGRFHFLEQAHALRAAGALHRFYCDDPRVFAAAGLERGRWLLRSGLLARWAPARASAQLSGRGEQLACAVDQARLVKINSAFALETIRRGAAGAVWVDHGSLDERYVSVRMQEEADRWGDHLVAAGGNHDSAQLVDRQAEEFATAAGVVVASELAARSAMEQGVPAAKLRVVPLGVDARRFAPRLDPALRPRRRFRILHAGPVNFNKGVHRLIAAFRAAALPDAELWIAGLFPNAAVRERLVRQADGLAIEFRPPVAQSRLPELFEQCDLFALASLADGFGLTVLQAMACQLPAVVTTQCGCHEVLDGCPAVEAVPAGDTMALASAVTTAYLRRADQPERGREARRWVARLDWHAHAACLRRALNDGAPLGEIRLAPRGAQS